MSVLNKLSKFYLNSKLTKGYIGKTEKGKNIPFFLVEKTSYPTVIVQASIHAREYITTYLCLKLIKHFNRHGKKGRVFFIPMVNLDGVEICLQGKPNYKANANGVDLNVNFDAKWGKGQKNLFTSGEENYVGKHPFSESESRALKDFTTLVGPDLTISYHSKGEEIYWEFFQDENTLKRDYVFAERAKKVTGYAVKSTPNSVGGYKDWCIDKLKIPALTIEVGSEQLTHPIGKKHLRKIYRQNKKLLNSLIQLF